MLYCARSVVLTALKVNILVVWDMKSYKLYSYQQFGGACSLHLHGRPNNILARRKLLRQAAAQVHITMKGVIFQNTGK
jgi:hypothetical protein